MKTINPIPEEVRISLEQILKNEAKNCPECNSKDSIEIVINSKLYRNCANCRCEWTMEKFLIYGDKK